MKIFLFIFILCSVGSSIIASPKEYYSPTLSLGLTNGLLVNTSLGRSDTYLGALSLGGEYFLTSKISLGLGYEMQVRLDEKNIPVSGFTLSTRWHFIGNGTKTRFEDQKLSYSHQETFSVYAGLDLLQRRYYSKAANVDGSSIVLNPGLGSKYTLTESFSCYAYLSAGLVTLNASTEIYAVTQNYLNIGVTYTF